MKQGLKIKILVKYEHSEGRWDISYLDIHGAQSSRKGEYVAKSGLTLRGTARSAGHVTRSDQHDWYVD